MNLEENWVTLMDTLQLHNPTKTYQQLIKVYTEKHHRYHTLKHIHSCLHHLSQTRKHAEHPQEIELALWFHDAIYNTRSTQNETNRQQTSCATTTQTLPAYNASHT